MKSNIKRFLGIMLATLMVVTMLPTVAFADLTTEGNPNAFSIVADATGVQQTEFILADTLTVGNNTYYGIMTRKNVNMHYGDIKTAGNTLNFTDDTTKTSTATAKYKKLISIYTYKDNATQQQVVVNLGDFDNYLTAIFPAAVQPYAQEIEMLYTDNPNNTSEKYYVTGKMFPPLKATIDANKDYINVPADTSNFRGLVTRTKSGWRGDWTYFASKYLNKSKDNAYSEGYAHLGATNYSYYVTPVVYVTKDFFKNVKIDTTKEIGANVKTFMANNLFMRDLSTTGYTEDELTLLGIQEKPTDYETKVEWSPNYADFAGLDLLFNGTMDKDGKTYFGFTWAKDFGGLSENALASTVQVYNATDAETGNVVGYDGEVLPNKNYGQILIVTGNRTVLGTADDYIIPLMPEVIGNNLLKTDWHIGDGYGMFPVQNYAAAKSYLRGKISLPSKDEATVHISYLKSMIDDNAQYARDWTGKAMTSRTQADTYRLYLYDSVSGEWKAGPGDRWVGASSTFPTFYVSEDALKAEKIDTISMGENVKAAIAANLSKAQLDDVYTEAELTAMGVTDTPANIKPVHSSKYVELSDGTQLLYIGTDEADGKKYANFLMIKDYAGTDAVEGIVWKKDAEDPTGAALDNSQYGEYYLSTGTVSVPSGDTLDAKVIPTLPSVMQGKLLLKEWAAGLQYTLNGSGNGTAKSKTYITLPSSDEILEFGPYIKSFMMDNTNGKSSSSQSSSSKAATIRTTGGYSQKTYDAEANAVVSLPSGIEYSAGSVFPVFAVDVDFLKDIKVNVSTIGADVVPLFADFIKSDFNVAYTDAEFEALGVNSFKQEVKPETISGNSFTYGGYTYVFIEDAVEEVDGKKYYGVVEKAGLRHNKSWGAIRYDLDAEKSDENTTYVKVGPASPWGGSWANSKATYDMQEETTRTFAPLASYLLDRDWTIKGSWDWNNQGTVTPLVMSGKIGIPTQVQFKNAINAGDLTLTVGAYHLNGLYYYAKDKYTYHEKVNTSGSSDSTLRATLKPSADSIVWSGGKVDGEFFFMGYVSEDFFKNTNIDATTIGSGAKTFLKSEFTRDELTGWTNDNLNLLFGGYEGEGLGVEIVNGTSVVVHNNGSEAAGKGALIIIASYNEAGMIDVKTLTLDAAVGANSKTSALPFALDTTGATSVKAMLWEDLLNAKPLTNAAFAN